MNKEIKNKLIELINESRSLTLSPEYIWCDEYKEIDKIYNMNKKEVVDILYKMALDYPIENPFENYNYILILYYLLLEHEDVGDDIKYLKSSYRKLILAIFSNNKYTKLRTLDRLTTIGFTKKESEDLYRVAVKTETDQEVLKKYKYEILSHEYYRLFPKQNGFDYGIRILELHSKGKINMVDLEDYIKSNIKKYGGKIVSEWIELFLKHEYASKDAKTALKQMKISDVLW